MKVGALWIAALMGAATAGSAFAAGSHPRARPALASFTTSQAYQGRFAYIQHCGECHGGDLGGQFGPALAGPHSNVPWQTPGAFYSYMTQQMPVGNAGGLSQTDYLNIAAFVLQSNGRRASAKRLTVNAITNDTTALDQSR
jgi:mono/diheme cytochrome c family protein